jgi:hypothetical protein
MFLLCLDVRHERRGLDLPLTTWNSGPANVPTKRARVALYSTTCDHA